MKKHYFFHRGTKRRFFLIFTMKLSSAVLSFLNAYSALNFVQRYFTGVFEDFDTIFLACSQKCLKILKVGKIFRCVTSFYQYFFVSDYSD